MKNRALFAFTVLGSVLNACQILSESTPTTVDGTITNQYTSLPVAGVPVSVTLCNYGMYGNTTYDSIASTLTDTQGHYSLNLGILGKGRYIARVLYSRDYYDLTFEPYVNIDNGAELKHGTANHIDIKVTDYKRVTVNANSNKSGQSDILFDLINADGNYYHETIFMDTVRAHQQISFKQVVKVLPNRKYNFVKTTANRTGQGYTATYSNYVRTAITRTVLYNDTTTINFH